jgi:hypothetical protein
MQHRVRKHTHRHSKGAGAMARDVTSSLLLPLARHFKFKLPLTLCSSIRSTLSCQWHLQHDTAHPPSLNLDLDSMHASAIVFEAHRK